MGKGRGGVLDFSPPFLGKTEQDKERHESSQPEMAMLLNLFLHKPFPRLSSNAPLNSGVPG